MSKLTYEDKINLYNDSYFEKVKQMENNTNRISVIDSILLLW